MAIANDFYIDYTNKLIAHSTHSIAYDGEANGGFTAGQLIGNTSATPTKTAIIVKVTDNGADGVLDVVYVVGSWANNDELYVVGGTKRGDVNGTPTLKATTYTTRALYSFIQDTFDELVQLDDTVPMSAQTPTEFTLINGWFIDDESIKFLYGGALQTSGYDGVIQIITHQSGGYTNALNSDIGKMVNDDGADTGNLLHFNNTTRKWWVRWGTTIASGSVITLDSSGTGAGTTNATGDYSGEDLYANVYTLGSIATNPNPRTYIFQNSSSISPWWGRGDSFAAIDVLIKVKESGTEIDGASITVFVRHYGDLYDHFGIDLTSGGRNAVPLSSATDLNNNTSGEVILSVTSAASFDVGNFVRGVTSGAYGEILSIDTAATPDTITLGNVVGASEFTNGETVNETTNGLASGDTATTTTLTAPHKTNVVSGYNDIKIWFVNGTITHGAITGGPYVEGETITGGTSAATGVMLLDSAGTMTLGNVVGTFASGETITGGTSSATATSTSTLTSAHTMNKAFTQGTNNPYSIVVNCATRTLSQVYEWFKYVTRDGANSSQLNRQIMYPVIASTVVQMDGEEYIAARVTPDTAFTPVKASPFGTFAGGKLFGAQGMWVQNMASSDIQSFQLIDSNGATRTPPNFQSLTVSGIVSGDKVIVLRTTSGTTINKAVFTATSGNNSGNTTFVVNETIPSDTPTSGTIRIVQASDTSINRETRYTYSSWSGSTFSGLSPALNRTYTATNDTAYVPYIDTTSGGTSVAVSVIYSADRTVLTRVRRYNGAGDSILPFETTGSYTSTGYSTAAIRTADSIVT